MSIPFPSNNLIISSSSSISSPLVVDVDVVDSSMSMKGSKLVSSVSLLPSNKLSILYSSSSFSILYSSSDSVVVVEPTDDPSHSLNSLHLYVQLQHIYILNIINELQRIFLYSTYPLTVHSSFLQESGGKPLSPSPLQHRLFWRVSGLV